MLATLPSELLDMIISRVSQYRDLKRLCEVSTRLHDITIPHLYQSLVLSAPELSLEGLAATLERIPFKYLKHTQELGFRIPIHERVESRCVHHIADGQFFDESVLDGLAASLIDDENLVLDADEDTEKGHLVSPFFNLCCALDSLSFPDNQLRSFRWEIGTCIPEVSFCGIHSFLKNQREIQSITLITDGECYGNESAHSFVDLVQFRELRFLDWRGLARYDDFESVRECIKVHGHQIQALTLDLLAWDRAEDIWTDGFRQQNPQSRRSPDNFFSQRVLNIQPREPNVIFSSLKDLRLSAVSFDHTGREMAYAFNIEHLKSLNLRNCPGSLDWLRLILNSGKQMKLKSLELTLDLTSLPRDASMHITETICNFIHHLSGLENLYLMLPEPFDWTTLTDRLLRHDHLKRFAMHHLVDNGGQDLIDGDIPWPVPLEHILQENQLSCFGSSIPPHALASHLQRMHPRPSCKLIHVRTSGVVLEKLLNAAKLSWFSDSLYTYKYGKDLPHNREEIYDFAQWAFSTNGLPNLQVLAWGDFSYEGRYSKFNLLLCRSESDSGYQTLTPSDRMFWDLVQDNMDMLAACPFDNILE